jgi:hypothetical protein
LKSPEGTPVLVTDEILSAKVLKERLGVPSLRDFAARLNAGGETSMTVTFDDGTEGTVEQIEGGAIIFGIYNPQDPSRVSMDMEYGYNTTGDEKVSAAEAGSRVTPDGISETVYNRITATFAGNGSRYTVASLYVTDNEPVQQVAAVFRSDPNGTVSVGVSTDHGEVVRYLGSEVDERGIHYGPAPLPPGYVAPGNEPGIQIATHPTLKEPYL